MATLREVIRATGHEIAAQLKKQGAVVTEVMTEIVCSNDWEVTVQLCPIDRVFPRGTDPRPMEEQLRELGLSIGIEPPDPSNLRAVERAAWEATTNEPTPRKVLARKAGYPLTPYFYTAVANLVKKGFLEVKDGGVKRR